MNIISIVGWKNSGKTTLVAAVVSDLTERGYRVSTIKHTHHGIDLDQPGRDSWLHREAGAHQVMLASDRRWALMTEHRQAPPPAVADLVTALDPVDLVILEGFKEGPHPKIAVTRTQPNDAPDVEKLIAVAINQPTASGDTVDFQGQTLPRLDLNAPHQVANFILEFFSLSG